MKPIYFSLIFGAGIVIGGTLGWTLKPSSEASSSEERKTVAVKQQRTFEPKQRFTSEFQSIEEGSFKLTDAQRKDSDYLRTLATALMKSLKGDHSWGTPNMDVMNQIVTAWAQNDLDQALAWIDQNTDGNARAMLCRQAIMKGMEKAPVRDKLDLFKSRGFTPEEISGFAGNLMFGYETMSTDTALYLLSHVTGDDYAASGGHAKFQPNFDFARFAQGTLDVMAANGGKGPQAYPMNFFSQWTRIDPQAAADFYFTHVLQKNGRNWTMTQIDSFLGGMRDAISDSDYTNYVSTILATQYQEKDRSSQSKSDLIKVALKDPDVFVKALEQIQNPDDQASLLKVALGTAAEGANGSTSTPLLLRNILSIYQSRPDGLAAIESYARELGQRNGDMEKESMIRNIGNQLTLLGYSPTDIQRIKTAGGIR